MRQLTTRSVDHCPYGRPLAPVANVRDVITNAVALSCCCQDCLTLWSSRKAAYKVAGPCSVTSNLRDNLGSLITEDLSSVWVCTSGSQVHEIGDAARDAAGIEQPIRS